MGISKRFPSTPGHAPNRDYQVANKKYVDDHAPYMEAGGSGTVGKLSKWATASSLTDSTNTDTQIASAVSNSHANTLDHTQNTDIGTSSASFYFGSATVDGSWQISISGSELLIRRREGGTWVTKGLFS